MSDDAWIALIVVALVASFLIETFRPRPRRGILWQGGDWIEVEEYERLGTMSKVGKIPTQVGEGPIPTWIETDRVKWRE